MIIGSFKKTADGGASGIISTLTVKAAARIEPVTGTTTEKAPTHRIKAGSAEIGAAWLKKRPDGSEWLSVKIDDPAFSEPIAATLSLNGDGELPMIWERRKPDQK